MKTSCLILVLLQIFTTNNFPQIYDSFSDGDFTSNPSWSGDIGDWVVADNNSSGTNGSGNTYTLRLAASVPALGTKYISSQMIGSWGIEQSWSFWMGRRSNSAATSDNQSIFWLWANESDLTSNTVDGYRIIFGNSGNDNLILQKVTDGSNTSIIVSDSAIVSAADISIMVRVTRNSSSIWNLYISEIPNMAGEGPSSSEIPSAENTSIFQGSILEDTYTNFDNGYLGIMAKHTSGSTALTGAEFDQIYFDTDASSLLPVELLNFNCRKKDGNILLNWETATELNNYGFEIERSTTNLRGFENLGGFQNAEEFESIGFVHGHGNSNSNKYYSFVDNNPLSCINNYRLKQIDFDGKYSYSIIISIEINYDNIISLGQNYPNPFNPVTRIPLLINVKASSNNGSKVFIGIYNLQGELVETLINKNLEAGKYEFLFNGKGLSSGFYYCLVSKGNYSETKKMLLIK